MDSPSFVSLFSGCGGFDLGFKSEGFRCCAAYDLDPLAVESHRKNLHSNARVADLQTERVHTEITQPVDVVVAGPPCQGFSTAGKRDIDDPRNHLLLVAGKLALRMKPTVFVAENVAGVTSGRHARYWNGLNRLFRESGYQTSAIKCHAETLGVPQTRTRMVLLAWNNGRERTLSLPIVSGGMLKDALANVSTHSQHSPTPFDSTSPIYRIASHIKPGQKLSNVRGGPAAVHTWHIPEVFGHTTAREKEVLEALLILRRRNRVRAFGDADPVSTAKLSAYVKRPVSSDLRSLIEKGYVKQRDGLNDLTHSFNGKYRRLNPDRPSLTVDTKFGDPRYFIHPYENRGFSVREAACIQGFPGWFTLAGATRDQYRLIGNAVPPPMSTQIAIIVREALLT